jgi:microcompartment protein CcmK/EutM
MQFAIVKGTLVATQKVTELTGVSLRVIAPCTDQRELVGEALIAVDPIGVREGDFVMWVGKREASLAIPGAKLSNHYPIDAAITGLIDDIG